MNIPKIISALQRAGMTQVQIGRFIGVSQSTVSDLATGKAGCNPSHKVIIGLTALAKKHRIKIE